MSFKSADLAGDAGFSWLLGPFRHPSFLRQMRRKILSEVGSPLKTAPSESACTSGQNSKLNVRDLGCYCAGMISLCGRSRVQIGEFFRISERVGWGMGNIAHFNTQWATKC